MENYDNMSDQAFMTSKTSSSLQNSSQIIPITHKEAQETLAHSSFMPDGASEMQHVENIITEDGSNLKITRAVRDLRDSSNEPYGRHVRETREKLGRNMKAFTDMQAEAYEKDGTKVKRTSVMSSVKYSSGNSSRPGLVQPSLMAHDPTVFFNDDYTKEITVDLNTQASSTQLQQAQEHLFYTEGVPYPKGFLPSPTFWHRPFMTFGRNQRNDAGVSVNFKKEGSESESSFSRHSRSSFRSNSHNQVDDKNRPSSLNAHLSSTPEKIDDKYRQRSLSAYQSNLRSQQSTQQKSTQMSSSSFHSSTTSNQSQFRKSSFSGMPPMHPITEAKVPVVTDNIPPTFSYEIENVTVEKGGTAYFRGTVNGSYPFDTIWYLNNNELRSTNPNIETSIRRDYTETYMTGLIDYIISLKVHNCTNRDAGNYTAYIRNQAGDANCSAFLIVGGRIANLIKLNHNHNT